MRPRARQQAGFSLLEAIIAMTIMATSLLALYAWLSTSTLALRHASASSQSLQDARAALAMSQNINPLEQPTGKIQVPPLELSWTSTPVTDIKHGMTASGTATQFDLRLFDVDINVTRDGQVVREFTVRRAGWVAARPLIPDDY